MKYSEIVWDSKNFNIPEALGVPRADQLTSTSLDNLCELAGRTCYDSLGSGRDSKAYHAHVVEVNHGSVWEHGNLTFSILLDTATYLACMEALVNRPGVWVCKESPKILPANMRSGFNLRVTANLRAIREWHDLPPLNNLSILMGNQIQFLAKEKAPLLLADIETTDTGMPLSLVEPKYEDEMWVSFFFTNISRGMSHEIVRHRHFTAISQRSTRYVDECDSKWSWHPLILKNIDLEERFVLDKDSSGLNINYQYSINDIQKLCQKGYQALVEKLQNQLITEGTDKFNARKQARGAARGILGNALMTELIFSANISQWKWMLQLRANPAADAEIRVVMNEVYEQLLQRFPSNFKNYEKAECPDKIGFALNETKP